MISALAIGFFGSVHCAGMCGPLNLSFAGHSVKSFLTYHFGRVLSYAFIGSIFGALSESLSFFHLQHVMALAGGVLLLLVYGIPMFRQKLEGLYYQSSFYLFIKTKLTGQFRGPFKWLASGMLNGFLPCGLVYMAAAGALLAGGFWLSITYMTLFALGTLPSMIALMLARQKLTGFFGNLSRFVMPIGLISAGIIIFRGIMIDMPNINDLVRTHVTGFITACGF